MTLTKALGHFFSTLFHPLWMPTVAFALFIESNPFLYANYELPHKILELSKVFIYTALLPGFTILMLFALKFIKNVDTVGREERILPYVSTGFFYIVATVFYMRANEHPVLVSIVLGATIAIFAGMMVNLLFMKISIHATAAGAMIAIVMIMIPVSSHDLTWALPAALLMAGLVGSSRLALNAHNGRELLAGYFLGYLSQWLSYAITG